MTVASLDEEVSVVPISDDEIRAILPPGAEWHIVSAGGIPLVVSLAVVSPEWARSVLDEKNDENFRRLSESRSLRYAASMAGNHFDVNGQTVSFAWSGKLKDGQSRLRGCDISNRAFMTLIVIGVERDANIDDGGKRTLADLLHRRGEKDANVLAATLTHVARWEVGKLGWVTGNVPSLDISKTAMMEVFTRHPRVADSVAFCGKKTPLPKSMISALHYLFGKQDGRDVAAADQFVESLHTQLNLGPEDPAYVLYRRLTSIPGGATKKSKVQLRKTVMMALTIKAWNYFKKAKPCFTLKWAEFGERKEAFPEIE